MSKEQRLRIVERKMKVGLPITRKERALYMLYGKNYQAVKEYCR